jgi:hypothetical protein
MIFESVYLKLLCQYMMLAVNSELVCVCTSVAMLCVCSKMHSTLAVGRFLARRPMCHSELWSLHTLSVHTVQHTALRCCHTVQHLLTMNTHLLYHRNNINHIINNNNNAVNAGA